MSVMALSAKEEKLMIAVLDGVQSPRGQVGRCSSPISRKAEMDRWFADTSDSGGNDPGPNERSRAIWLGSDFRGKGS